MYESMTFYKLLALVFDRYAGANHLKGLSLLNSCGQKDFHKNIN